MEEFHVGFEYEEFTRPGWIKVMIEKRSDLAWLMDESCKVIDLNGIRVKHLDQQDIEELGFEIISEIKLKSYELTNACTHFIRTTLKRTFVDEDVIITMYDQQRVIIRRNNTRNMRDYDKYKTFDVFIGSIKNKSELKRIMKMIGI